MNGGDSTSPARLYKALVDRCERLEASHVCLKKQFKSLLKEKSSTANYDRINDNDRRRRRSSTVEMTSDSGEKRLDIDDSSCAYVIGGAYRNVLQCMGHAVYVTRPASGEIIFCRFSCLSTLESFSIAGGTVHHTNRLLKIDSLILQSISGKSIGVVSRNNAAEKLFGYKGYELNGRKFTALHIDEEYMLLAKKIMERLRCGESWSGQFPFKKKSGEIFMALVTQSPLYEDSEFVGIITVSSDAAVFNSQDDPQPPIMELNDQDDRHYLLRGLNLKRIQWANRPQITSSVSDLASKVLLRKRGDSKCNEVYNDKEENELENPEIKSESRPPRVPARRQIFQFAKSFKENRRVEGDGLLKREEAARGEFLQHS